MKQSDGYFAGADGNNIYYQYWQPDAPAKAVILLVHGAGEHCARYQHVAEFFVGHVFAVVALDHAGHGRSEGTRAYIHAFDDYIATLDIFQQRVAGDFPALPQFLLGHSLGGLISSCYLLKNQHKFKACVLSGPAIKSELEPGVLQLTLIRILSTLLPRLGALQLDASGVSRDPEVVEHYRADPLVHGGKMTARLIAELFAAMNVVQENAGAIELPMLLLHGGGDSMTSPEGSRFLYENVGSRVKDIKIYPELFHEILNEPEKEQVMEDILNWLEERLRA